MGTFTGNAAEFKVLYVMESCKLVLAIKKNITLITRYFCFVFNFQLFLQLLCISLVLLIFFFYSAQIMLEYALFCRQNARLKNRLFCSKFRLDFQPFEGVRFFRSSSARRNAGTQNGWKSSLLEILPGRIYPSLLLEQSSSPRSPIFSSAAPSRP